LLDKCGGELCESIKDIGSISQSVWKMPAGTICSSCDGDNVYSLDDIEHGYDLPPAHTHAGDPYTSRVW
jgi:hypothetical protein